MVNSETINDLLAELVEVQNELPTMPKNTKAYGYKYTDLDTITQTIKPILHKHGIGYMQSVGGFDNITTLTTRLFNKKGEYIEDVAVLPKIESTKNNNAQTLGMAITYMRRYCLCALLGITSDEDIDCNTKPQGNSLPPPVEAAKNAFSGKVQTPAPKLDFVPAGGETTPAEKEELKALLTNKFADGTPIFNKDEIKGFSDMRKDYTARQVIDHIKGEIQKRITPPQAEQQQGFDIF